MLPYVSSLQISCITKILNANLPPEILANPWYGTSTDCVWFEDKYRKTKTMVISKNRNVNINIKTNTNRKVARMLDNERFESRNRNILQNRKRCPQDETLANKPLSFVED